MEFAGVNLSGLSPMEVDYVVRTPLKQAKSAHQLMVSPTENRLNALRLMGLPGWEKKKVFFFFLKK